MNRIYRVVFNAKLGLWQVASESCKARKKSGGRKASLVMAAAALVSANAVAQGTITATGDVSITPPPTGPWNISGTLNVGMTAGSTGHLEIKEGAEVNVTGLQSVTVGGGLGAEGTIVVDGAGSTLTVRTTISLGGNFSKGALEVRNGGAVQAGNIFVNESGEGGRLLVTGGGSTVTVDNTLTVLSPNPGDPGEVLIEKGGAVTAKTVRIKASDGAESRVIVTGAESSLIVADKILMDGEIPPSKGSVLVVQEGATVKANSIDMNPARTLDTYAARIYVGGASQDAVDAKAAGKLDVGTISFGEMKGELNLNHTDANYILNASLISQVAGNHQQLNQIAGHTTLTSDSSGFNGTTTVSGGTLIVQNSLGGAAAVTSGTLQYGAAGVGATSNLSSLTVSGANSTLLIKGTAALNVTGQVAINNSAKLKMDVVPSTSAVVTANSFNIGTGTVLDISGITNVSQLGTDLVLFDTTSGIQNDFDSVIVRGYQAQNEDYLTVNTRKSADGKQYLAKKGLSWTANNNLAHGNFTLNTGGEFTVSADLKDEKANAVTGWDGKTLTKKGAGTLILSGNNSYTGDTIVEGGTLQVSKDSNLGGLSSVLRMTGQNTTLATTSTFTTSRELDLQKDATVSVADATSLTWGGTINGTGTTLSKKGKGTLVLGGTNGAISHNIAEGTLQVGSNENLGTGTDAINLSGGTLATTGTFTATRDMLLSKTSGIDVASGTELALSGKVSGTGDLVKTGAGTLNLQNTGNAYANTDVQAGLLKGDAASIKGNLKNAGAVEFAQATDATFTGAISGTGSLAKTGAGTLVLTAQHTGSTVTVTGGTLQYGNGTASAANHLTGDVSVSGTDSALGVMGPATLTVDGDVNMADNTQLSLGAMSNGAVLTANEVNLGQNVSFMLNGVSQTATNEILVIDTTTGITGDFASVNVGGASGAVDYLTVGTHKSANQKQFYAKYELSWLANNNNAHGTFTLTTAVEKFTVDVDLKDQTANPDTGWDGKTLTKAGAGTLTLSGNNSYTGDTLVQGGVLSISSNQNLGDASSNLVMNGGGLATTASFAADRHMDLQQTAAVHVAADTKVDWQGLIDGAGGLTKDGAGTLVLSGANNYAGVTTIAGGTLQIDSDARLGTAPNMVFDGGGLATTATFNSGREIALKKTGFVDVADSTELGLQGEISGAGGLRKVGAGTLTLAGTNSYAGDTTLGAGITQISSDANLGASGGAVVFEGGNLTATASLNSARKFTLNKTGNVAVAAGATLGVDGVVAGKGDLLKTGQGTLTLHNTGNAYGNTLVQEGTLVAQAGSVSGHIANAATVVFDQATDASFANDIVGLNNQKGTMVKQGQGTLTLTGQSALDWNVDAGQLTTAAERFGGNANIASGAALAFNQTANADYAGQVAGTGEFRKQGAGSLQITGDSSAFNGHVNVESGVLAVNGKLGGKQATIADGATLAGSGTLGSGSGSTVTIAKGGVLSPGNSIDKLTVDGDLVFQSGSRFDVEVDPKGTASDLVHVTGNASLAGAVAHIGETGDYKLNAAYTILTAEGSVNGTFDSVKSDFAFLNPELKYNYSDSEVQLILKRNGTTFDARGRTPNQRATARGLESMGSTATHAVYTAIAKLPDNQAVIERSLDALSGEIYASTKTALIDDSRFVRDAATDRMRSAFGGVGSTGSAVLADRQLAQANTTGTAAWAQTFGNWGDTDSDGNAHKLKRRTYGFLVGADTPLGDGSWRVGALAGYSHTKADADDVNSSNKGDNYHLGLYGGGQWDELGVRVGVAHSWHEMTAKRSVTIPGFSDDLKSSPKSRTTQIFADVGYNIDAGSIQLEPFANLAYVNLSSRSFSERGGDAALNVKSDNTNISYMTLGSRFSTEMEVGSTKVMANASLGWRHALGGVTPESTHRFSAGNAFTVYGVPLSRDSAVLEAGLGVQLSPSVTLGVSYQGQLGSDGNDHGVRANLGIQF